MIRKFNSVSFSMRRVIIAFSVIIPAVVSAFQNFDSFLMTAGLFFAIFFLYWILVLTVTAIIIK